jgi:UDP-N-acetylenolpyruvoylglucosamine reductase
VKLARKKVLERSGIKLELEVKLIGFQEEEIMQAVA